jgi:hypothetical protein|tara:strand:- start:3682 stop:3828 length:147 start_codon:yes stop_codon:yes gene_type:complete
MAENRKDVVVNVTGVSISTVIKLEKDDNQRSPSEDKAGASKQEKPASE